MSEGHNGKYIQLLGTIKIRFSRVSALYYETCFEFWSESKLVTWIAYPLAVTSGWGNVQFLEQQETVRMQIDFQR